MKTGRKAQPPLVDPNQFAKRLVDMATGQRPKGRKPLSGNDSGARATLPATHKQELPRE